jgi:hypothetical protein
MIIDNILAKTIGTSFHRKLLRLHRKLFPLPKDWFDAKGAAANDLIRQTLESNPPCLIGKLGSIELETIIAYLYKDKRMLPWERLYRYISGDVRYKNWHPQLLKKLSNNAGVFSTNEPYISQFVELYLSVLPHVDLLHSWQQAETLLATYMPHAKRISGALGVWTGERPAWSSALRDKKVLVIHPFDRSIREQYARRELLFNREDILPPFELTTIRAVQSAGAERVPFENWFEALQFMMNQISATEFEIALIGAGAYSLPLGDFVKSLGKKAIHLGGDTQLLFGIYGSRWIGNPVIEGLINEHWVRPSVEERISNFSSIERGSYW